MRKTTFFFPILFLLAGFLFAFSSPALADDDPPGRVARLNYIQGSVSFQPGGETDWTQANPNRPLTTGDSLWGDRNSRGELHIGSSSVRIGSETGITFLNLDDRTVQIQLAQGSLNVRVRRLEGGDAFEIDTPNLAFTLERAGEYRFDVDPNGNATSIAVRQGEGDATGGGSEYHMDSGDQANFSGTDTLTYDGGQAGRLDDFDNWCRSRDDREERSQSARYVSRDVIGYDDLDDYGEWRDVPDYGHVWYPTRVDAGWAPYRNGHWVWVAPWGWTWVEDEPWGFAPFHYGRWAEVGGGWCWVPGPVVVRPVYAPALVVFVGGPRFSVSFGGGGGGVAWFPLGPREVYVPPYRTSERYVQNVNVTNTTVNVVNVTNVYNNVNVNKVTYVNQNNVNAVTAVSHDTFVNARPVAAANVRVNAQQMQAAQVQRNVAVAPVQKSVVGTGAVATVKPPAAVMQRQVVAKQTPPPAHASFNNSNVASQPARSFRPAVAPGQQPQQQTLTRQQPGQPQNRQLQPPAQQATQPAIQQQQHPQLQQQLPGQPQNRQLQPPPQQAAQPAIQQQQPGQPQNRQPQPAPQQTAQPAIQQQQPAQPQFRKPPSPQQPPPQQQIQQQQAHPQVDQTRKPPEPQNPPVKFAPPARATEDTYHPHQFEKPQEAAPPRPSAPPPAAKEQPKPQERGQESKKPDDKERK